MVLHRKRNRIFLESQHCAQGTVPLQANSKSQRKGSLHVDGDPVDQRKVMSWLVSFSVEKNQCSGVTHSCVSEGTFFLMWTPLSPCRHLVTHSRTGIPRAFALSLLRDQSSGHVSLSQSWSLSCAGCFQGWLPCQHVCADGDNGQKKESLEFK